MNIVELFGDDWSAIYFDGQKNWSGHSPRLRETMEEIVARQVPVESYEYIDMDEYGYEYGDPDNFPEVLDVEEYKRGPK